MVTHLYTGEYNVYISYADAYKLSTYIEYGNEHVHACVYTEVWTSFT